MIALRLLLALLVLAWASAPLAIYFGHLARVLVHSGHPAMAIACLAGTVTWFAVSLRALPALKGSR